MGKDVLIVYIHGFMGSQDSFETFPQALESASSHQLSLQSLSFPTFDTKGSNAQAVMKLVDWLLLNASTLEYKSVILLSHSMGGLLAMDAYRYLYHDELSALKPLSDGPSETGSGIESARALVNITAILNIDSPVYGLDPRILTQSSIRNAQQAVTSIRPSVAHLAHLIPKSVDVPIGLKNMSVPVSTEWMASQATSVYESYTRSMPVATAPDVQPDVQPGAQSKSNQDMTAETKTLEPKESTMTKWSLAKYAVAGAAGIAAMAYLPLGLSLLPATALARSSLTSWAVSTAEDVRHHLEFLYPLATSFKDMHARVMDIVRGHTHQQVYFRCFYLKDTLESRYFCQMPPPEVEDYFESHSSFSQDEIEGHMHVFSESLNGPLFHALVNRISQILLEHAGPTTCHLENS